MCFIHKKSKILFALQNQFYITAIEDAYSTNTNNSKVLSNKVYFLLDCESIGDCSTSSSFQDLGCWSAHFLNKWKSRIWLLNSLVGDELHYFYFVAQTRKNIHPTPPLWMWRSWKYSLISSIYHPTYPPPADFLAFGRNYLNSLWQYRLLQAKEKL